MNAWRVSAAFLLASVIGNPCSVSFPRTLWSKNSGTNSDLFAFEQDGRVGFIDAAGRIVIGPVIEGPIDSVGDFFNGVARVGDKGYVDTSGNWVIRGDYRSIRDFSEGLALVLTEGPKKYSHSAMYIDLTGKFVAQVPAFRTGAFSEGLAAYEAEGKPALRRFQPGKFEYRDYPGLKGFIDRTGRLVIQPAYAEVGPFVGGLARVVLDGYCHLATPEGGKEGTPTTGYPTSCGGAPADAAAPCGVGFIDKTGRMAIQPRFESARDYQEGLAAVKVDGLWGFIDVRGQYAIPPRFELTQSFSEGLAAVRVMGKWGYIDKKGDAIIRAQFEDVEPFSDGMAIAYRSRRPFYIDRTGKIKLTGPYREGTPFHQGLAAVLLSEHDVAYIDRTGTTIFRYWRK